MEEIRKIVSEINMNGCAECKYNDICISNGLQHDCKYIKDSVKNRFDVIPMFLSQFM